MKANTYYLFVLLLIATTSSLRAATVTGRLIWDDSTPASGSVAVGVISDTNSLYLSAISDATRRAKSEQTTTQPDTNGYYRIENIPVGVAIMVIADDDRSLHGPSRTKVITVQSGQTLSNLDFVFPVHPAEIINLQGAVTIDGLPLGGGIEGLVSVFHVDGSVGSFTYIDGGDGGHFDFRDLPPGQYKLRAEVQKQNRSIIHQTVDVGVPALGAATVTINVPTVGSDTTPPVITILGNTPATVECHATYTDAGATATDDQAGNLTAAIVVSNAVNSAVVGGYTVAYAVSDPAGNRATATRTVNVVDTTPPQSTCPGNMSVGCSTNLDTPVSFTVTATDVCAAQPVITSTPAAGTGFKVGATPVTCTARDATGNTNSCTFTVTRAALGFTGFLAPVGGADGTGGDYAHPLRTFKLKSTVPVKFTANCSGAAVTAGVHTLQVIKYSDETTAADPLDATPTDAASTGNQFHLTNGEWHFNLDTKATGMTAGTWLLRATLSDGSVHSAWIALK